MKTQTTGLQDEFFAVFGMEIACGIFTSAFKLESLTWTLALALQNESEKEKTHGCSKHGDDRWDKTEFR